MKDNIAIHQEGGGGGVCVCVGGGGGTTYCNNTIWELMVGGEM